MTFQISKSRKGNASLFALLNMKKDTKVASFKQRVLVTALFIMATFSIHAQQSSMQALIDQSLSKLQEPTPQLFLNCIAELKRIDAMFPDSIQPKYQMALQSLNFSVMNPHAEQTENVLAEAEQAIAQLSKMKQADPSDLCTLNGFLYLVRIVQNPSQNGQRYYIDVMQYFEKALKLNPDNLLAQQLQQKFLEGMKQATSHKKN